MTQCKGVGLCASLLSAAFLLSACSSGGDAAATDDTPVLDVGDATVTEGDAGTVSLVFPVGLSTTSTLDVTADFQLVDNTAVVGADYRFASGTLQIAAGQRSTTIPVAVFGDTDIEGDEDFAVVVSNIVNADGGQTRGTGTILDDDVLNPPPDPSPALRVEDTQIVEGDAGTVTVDVAVTLSAAATEQVTLDYATVANSANENSDYVVAVGVLIIDIGQAQGSISIDVHGDTDVEADETFIVVVGNVTGATVADNQAFVTIVNDDSVPPELVISDASKAEGDAGGSMLRFSVSLSAASSSDVTANYATTDGSATAGSDYDAGNGGITIPAGQLSTMIEVRIIGDTDDEGDETFAVTLSNPGNANLIVANAVGTILDDDDAGPPPPPLPALSIGNTQINEGDTGTSQVNVVVMLSPAATVQVTMDFTTVAGSASAGSDYIAAAGPLVIDIGQTQASIAVDVRGDMDVEGDESFRVEISNVSGATVTNNQAFVTILDDDVALPDMIIGNVSRPEGDGGSAAMTFTVSLSAIASSDVTANYATSNGSATAGSDYTAASGSLTIPTGQSSANIDVMILGDTVEESDETFNVTLSNPANATLIGAVGTGTIFNDDGPLSGLDTRPSNATCIAPDRPTAGSSVTTADAFAAAPNFVRMTKILQAPGDASRWFVLEKHGLIKVFSVNSPNAVTTYLDFSGSNVVETNSEGGMLGMAFDPNFPATPEVYLSYTAPGSPTQSRVSRIILDNTDNPVNPTEQVILTVNQPWDNHNGGEIAFGPDGRLYIGFGDGGGQNDTGENAEDTKNLLGSVLRIEVRGVAYPSPRYTIPPDNPFVGNPPNPKCGPGDNAQDCPEIYAWGFRNPWRFSFDGQTGQLWLGDVGQNSWEEVDIVQRGGNYGWDLCEGLANLEANNCPVPGSVAPVSVYSHANSNWSITGGYVYRGSALPGLVGRYVFGDYISGRVWALADDGQGGYTNQELIDTPYNISSFARGEDGELYFSHYDTGAGRIYKLVPDAGGPGNTIPDNLADTGCVDLVDNSQPAAGLIPFRINAPFWSDNAVKTRYLAVPDAGTIDIDANDDFDFPSGSVLIKSFELNNKLIETRLLMRHTDGVWAGYTYEWNDLETAATRVIGGKTKLVGGQTWIYPSEGECMACHTTAAGLSLGPELAQLNGDLTYPSTGRTANQLATLEHIGMFSAPLADTPDNLARLADPGDSGESLDARARAYLHTNCAQCHRSGGPAPSSMDFHYGTPLSATFACDVVPQSGNLGIANALLIAPGDASRSIVVERMSLRDVNGMPPLGSAVADAAGVALIGAWIDSLSGCGS